MAKVDRQKMEDYIREKQENFSEEDYKKVVDKEKSIFDIFSKAGPLKEYFEKAKLLFSMIKDYYRGDYREISSMNIALIGAIFLYVLSPIDLIPDFIPLAGYLDDAAVIAYGLKKLNNEIEKYQLWQSTRMEREEQETEDFAEREGSTVHEPMVQPMGS